MLFRSVGAVASFYGGGVVNGRFGLDPLADMLREITCPWIGLYGELDKGIPAEHVDAIRTAMSESALSPQHVLHYYPNADHSFHCTDRTNVFEPTAAAAAEARQGYPAPSSRPAVSVKRLAADFKHGQGLVVIGLDKPLEGEDHPLQFVRRQLQVRLQFRLKMPHQTL